MVPIDFREPRDDFGTMEDTTIDPKRHKVIDGAARVFTRYGFTRATMGDIAKEAGVSRPTLYLLFKNKEEVLDAVVDHWTDENLRRIEAAIAPLPTLGAQLRMACELWAVDAFEVAQTNPVVMELNGHPAFAKSYARFEACLQSILQPSNEQSAAFTSAEPLARITVAAILGFKQIAGSANDLRELIATQAAVLETAVATKTPASHAAFSSAS